MELSSVLVRVAFAGAMKIDHQDKLDQSLEMAFRLINETTDQFLADKIKPAQDAVNMTNNPPTYGDVYSTIFGLEVANGQNLELITGYAKGADTQAVSKWHELGLGKVHGLFPFMDDKDPNNFAWTHGPEILDEQFKVSLDLALHGRRLFDKTTVLDGKSYQEEKPSRSGHLEQSRWLVRWADIVVVAWDGQRANGPGGTADTVAAAFAKNLPIVWIDLSHKQAEQYVVRLIDRRHNLPPDYSFFEFLGDVSQIDDDKGKRADRRNRLAPQLLKDALLLCLKDIYQPPDHEISLVANDLMRPVRPDARRATAAGNWNRSELVDLFQTGDELAKTTDGFFGKIWTSVYALFEPQKMSSESGFAELFSFFFSKNGHSNQQAVTRHLNLLEAVQNIADQRASMIGNEHRGVQILLLFLAFIAVLAGTSPALFPDIKIWAVGFECFVIAYSAWLWSSSRKSKTHQKWSNYRYLAERWRGIVATWPLGFDIFDDRNAACAKWMEWRTEALLRQIGMPQGVFSEHRQRMMMKNVRFVDGGLIQGQISYNHKTHHRLHAFHSALHTYELIALFVLLAVLMFYAAYYLILPGWKPVIMFDTINGFTLLLLMSLLLALILGLFLKIVFQIKDPVLMRLLSMMLVIGGLYMLYYFAFSGLNVEINKNNLGGLVLMLSALIPLTAAICIASEAKFGLQENAARSEDLRNKFKELNEMIEDNHSLTAQKYYIRLAALELMNEVTNWSEDAIRRDVAAM